jgi:hypothetical protein
MDDRSKNLASPVSPQLLQQALNTIRDLAGDNLITFV